MKKVTLFLLVFFLFSNIAYGYVWTYKGYSLLNLGLGPAEVSTQSWGEGISYKIVIKGEDLVNFTANNANIFEHTNKEISLQPKKSFFCNRSGYGGYCFWLISGNFKIKPFFMLGITLEGDLMDNKIIPNLFLLIVIITLIPIIFLIIKKERKKSARKKSN